VHANGVPGRLGLALLPGAAPFSAGEQAALEVLRRDPTIPVLLLHDASMEGCLLVETVLPSLGLSPRHHLIDIGLHPRDVMKHWLVTLYQHVPSDTWRRFQEFAALPEQTRIARGVRLDGTELKWLEDCIYSPVRALTPKQLIGLIRHAVARATRVAPRRNNEALAERRAQAVGFLTWPQ